MNYLRWDQELVGRGAEEGGWKDNGACDMKVLRRLEEKMRKKGRVEGDEKGGESSKTHATRKCPDVSNVMYVNLENIYKIK